MLSSPLKVNDEQLSFLRFFKKQIYTTCLLRSELNIIFALKNPNIHKC